MELVITSPVRRYETVELAFHGAEPKGSAAVVDLQGMFSHNGAEISVKGFYAGDGVYKLRYLPEESGAYQYRLTGSVLAEPVEGTLDVLPADGTHHGIVRADGIHLRHADGTWFHSFGTTIYAFAHQEDALIDETMRTLAAAPFNKLRMCVFPKHYHYNSNEPKFYPFQKKTGLPEKRFPAQETPVHPLVRLQPERDAYWDVHHPDYAFWDRFESRLQQLQEMGIQIDLIIFHPYDRWGFANLSPEDNLTYLDYLLRRLSAFPNIWWSLANEYDLCASKTMEDWYAIEAFVAENDPYHHLIGNHNCFQMWDAGREKTTHVSWQSKQFYRVEEMQRRYGKPVLIDECRYEGSIPEFWGNISGRDMARSFWRVTVQGGYCTHGETFLPETPQGKLATETGEPEVIWWAKGGRLNGESPARIAFLREIIENLPGPLEPLTGLAGLLGKTDEEAQKALQNTGEEHQFFMDRFLWMNQRERDNFLAVEFAYAGHCGEDAFLYYKDDQCCASAILELPETYTYQIEVIDTWEMTRETVLRGARGNIKVILPGKPFMAVLALREK